MSSTHPTASHLVSTPAPAVEDRRRRWFAIEDVAGRWDMSAIFVRRLIWRGELTARKFGRHLRVSKAEVERYEALRPTA